MATMKMSMRSSVMRPAVSLRSSRGKLQVVASKGGEEGGKTFDKSVYGIMASNANYALLSSSLKKVRVVTTARDVDSSSSIRVADADSMRARGVQVA